MPMRGARYLAETLQSYGVTNVFFVPTILSATLAEMEATGIKRVLTHGEKAAAYMADGYARVTGRPGVCLAQQIGASNLAAGLRDPWLARSPVIALVGTTSAQNRNRTVYQQVDDLDQFRPVTKWAARVENLADLPQALHQAFREATSGSPGPVVLQLPGHFGETIENGSAEIRVEADKRFARVPAFRPRAEQDAVKAALQRLSEAERPVIVAGGGARHSQAGAALVAFAERLQIPVATSMNAKALMPAGHPLSAGVIGTYSRESANRTIAEADVVFFVGSGTGSQVTTNWKLPGANAKIIQLDIDPHELGRHYFGGVLLLGDVKVTLEEMAALASDSARGRDAWTRRVKQLRDDWYASEAKLLGSDAVPIRPERIFAELNGVLGRDAVVAVDTGHAGMWGATYLDLNQPGQDFIRAAGSLGWGLPAAIGAKLAAPERPVVLFTGDGGLWYHLSELETAARVGANVVIVVNNNNCLNQEYEVYKEAYGGELRGNHHELWHFRHVNFANMAESMGAFGVRVERPADIRAALKEALLQNRPSVVEIMSDPDALAPLAYTGGAHRMSYTGGNA
jgi:acetolactate synthase-1/2/3 large subunit